MKLTRDFYIPSNYVEFKPEIGDYPKNLFQCYVDKEKPIALFFIGKQTKPAWHYRFPSNDRMKEKITSSISSLMSWEDKKLQRKEERQQPTSLQVGDILYSTWGYEQTNVDFYQVVKKIGTRTVVVREIAQERTPTAWEQYDAKPVPNHFTSDEIKKVAVGDSIHLNSYKTASKWHGKPVHGTSYA